MAKLLLIDGNSLVFRAYHATSHSRPMTTSNGIPTNALYGFALMVQAAVGKFNPDRILVAFDTGEKTFRHRLYPEYKGTRKKPDEELIVQFPIVREYLDAMNLSRYELAGYEADDIIGTMVATHPADAIAILSGDRDLLQLINEHTEVWLMKKGISEMQEVGLTELKQDFGLTPAQVIDLKGLMGDASDNIPGIAHVGEKTALQLLDKYQTLESVLAHDQEIKGKLGEYIRESHAVAGLSKELATIDRQVPLKIADQTLDYHSDPERQYEFYRKYELQSFIKQLNYVPAAASEHAAAASELKFFDLGQFNTPTALFSVYSDRSHDSSCFRGFGLANARGNWFLRYEDAKTEAFRSWAAGSAEKIVYDSKELFHCLDDLFGIKEQSPAMFDEMIAAFLIKDTVTSYPILAQEYSARLEVTPEDLYGKSGKPKLADPDLEIRYAGENAAFLFATAPTLRERLHELAMDGLYRDLEAPLAQVLYHMESAGIRIDQDSLDQLAKSAEKRIDACSTAIYGQAGEQFNINSTKKLAEILYDKLGLPGGKKRSTAIDVLERLKPIHPIIPLIIEYRKYQKFYSTYAEGLKKYIRADGKIHTRYNQCIVSTGRLSSTEPNLQNITVRDEESREIRKAFVAEPGCVLMAADYAQIELRVLAHMADEPLLIETFRENIDVHTRTAMDVFHVAKDQVTDVMRRKAKTVNFGIIYGISDYGLAERLGISREEAGRYIRDYFASYPRVRQFMEDTIAFCEKNGYVKTLLNRRREIPEINDREYMKREFGKRAAMNAPIQGTAADLIKLAMIKIQQAIEDQGLKSQMILQVHDELIFNVPEPEKEKMRQVIENGMQHAMALKVPLVAECVWGHDWYEAD